MSKCETCKCGPNFFKQTRKNEQPPCKYRKHHLNILKDIMDTIETEQRLFVNAEEITQMIEGRSQFLSTWMREDVKEAAELGIKSGRYGMYYELMPVIEASWGLFKNFPDGILTEGLENLKNALKNIPPLEKE